MYCSNPQRPKPQTGRNSFIQQKMLKTRDQTYLPSNSCAQPPHGLRNVKKVNGPLPKDSLPPASGLPFIVPVRTWRWTSCLGVSVDMEREEVVWSDWKGSFNLTVCEWKRLLKPANEPPIYRCANLIYQPQPLQCGFNVLITLFMSVKVTSIKRKRKGSLTFQ